MKENECMESLISRFLNGDCTSEENQQLKEWIEESPENKKEFLALKDIWDSSRKYHDRAEVQLALFYKNQLEKANQSRIRWIRYSAAVAAIIVFGLVVWGLLPQSTTSQPDKFQVFSVPLGSRSKVLLADGTEVNLNSGSELRYSSGYSSANRVVYLKGEGYFQVKSDKDHPFIVKTTDFDVVATGTSFNVCSYLNNRYSNTTLAEGKVHIQMNSSGQLFDVKQGDKFELNRNSMKYVLAKADIESEVAWKNGEFIFQKIPFPDLVQRLERWYDVKLNYSGQELQNFAFTGRFKNQETIWQVLDALKLTSPIDYSKTTFREFTIIYKPLKTN